ncbi:UNVERIFIED_CONTAM: hypothetical protein RMT77_005326 [Armadillidium vulgare]
MKLHKHSLFLLSLIHFCNIQYSDSLDPRCPTNFGLYVDPSSCKRYISCWGGRGFSLSCGSNMVFNPETLSCQGGIQCPRIELSAPSTGETIRLSQSRQQGAGQIQIRQHGSWAYVTFSAFNDATASLVCQRLGYKGFLTWFSSTASATQGRNPNIVHLLCPVGSRTIGDCSTKACNSCSDKELVVSIRCETESSSRCPQSSNLWQRWGESCYLAKDDLILKREEASDVCKGLGGNLVSVDEQMEHEFLSSLLKNKEQDVEFYTDGAGMVFSGGRTTWFWKTNQFPLKYQRWWPGWNTTVRLGTTVLRPSFSSGSCVILKKSFPLYIGRNPRKIVVRTFPELDVEYDSGFFFFFADDCTTPRPFICEAKLVDIGCRTGIGTAYSGIANISANGNPCLRWSDPIINNLMGRAAHARASINSFNLSLLGNHNYCRNPNNSPRPWCFVDPEKTEDCDIPYCDPTNIETYLEQAASIPDISKPIIGNVPINILPNKPIEKPVFIEVTPLPIKPTTAATTVKKKVRCNTNDFQCEGSESCIHESQICDGTRQCPRGDDERSCKRFLTSFEKSKSSTLVMRSVIQVLFREDIGVCAKRCLDDNRCKGIFHDDQKRECGLSRLSVGESGLLHSTREDFYEVKSRQSLCGDQFICNNKKCISKSLECNEKNDCGDNSDESKCSSPFSHQIRLVGGKGPHEGNVQVLLKGRWGFICDDGFAWNEADLICKELGFSKSVKFTRNNHFGKNSKSWLRSSPLYWFSGLNCSSPAANILECTSNGIGHHECSPIEIAGVICRRDKEDCAEDQFQCNEKRTCIPRTHVCNNVMNCPDSSDETPDLCEDNGVVKLLSTKGAPGNAVGTVHVKHKSVWGTVCDDLFDEKHAQVVCRSLGYGPEWATPYTKAHFGRGTGGVLIDEPGCRGTENSLSKCPNHAWGPGNCDHSEDAGVFCSDEAKVRLVGGSTPNEGRVEILLGGVWGTICDDDFDDYDAKVVCRMLGYEGGGIAHKKGFFGKGNGPIWLDNVDCLGNETKLSQCRHSPPGTSACLHSEDVGITCFTSNLMKTFDRSLKNKLPTSCGYQTPPFNTFLYDNLAKIVGGRTIRRLDSPWLVSLQLREKGIQKHNCGGVVISEDLVLTAAHCFRNHGKNSYVVRVGEFDLEANEPSQEDFFIEKLFVHDDFDTKVEFNNDFAVIKIAKRSGRGIRLGSSIQPVCLPSFDDDYFSLTNCKITGWGTTNEQAEPIPERRPRAGAVHIYPMSTCTGETGYSMHEITSGMFCAGRMDGSVDTCTGDSGGPLTCEVNGQHILYGITSWGKGCGRKGQPGMYTKVTKYLRWLNSIVT